MRLTCPNKQHSNWPLLVEKIGIREAYREFIKNKGEIPSPDNYKESFKGIQATLKVVGALENPKAQTLFNKFYSSNPDKFYKELLNLGATKQQVELLREHNLENKYESLPEMIAGILGELGYTVEIKTATNPVYGSDVYTDEDGDEYENSGSPYRVGFISDSNEYVVTKNDTLLPERYTSEKEAVDYITSLSNEPSSYYSKLTVPGGAEGTYRELEIRAPEIIPIIKGHSAFSTNFGLGWIRSSDRAYNTYSPLEQDLAPEGKYIAVGDQGFNKEFSTSEERDKFIELQISGPKTRIIWELQSDIFQKGRGLEVLVGDVYDEFQTKPQEIDIDHPQNQFLQLLSKDNNWVTFFTKAVIQDSISKEYERVLFPSGNTANKIEGQETIEQYIKDRKGRMSIIDEAVVNLEKRIGTIDSLAEPVDSGELKASFVKNIEGLSREKVQLKKEIVNAEEGRNKFSAINFFYETTIKNILDKQGYKPERITDEHGNQWYEVNLANKHLEPIYFNKSGNITQGGFEKKISDHLRKLGVINHKQETIKGQKKWVIRRSTPDSYDPTRNTVEHIMFENFTKAQIYAQEFYNKHRFYPYILKKINRKTVVVEITKAGDIDIAFRKDIESNSQATEAVEKILDRLKTNTGVQYSIISSDEAQSLLENRWNGEKAFFYKGQVYLLDSGINLNNAIHEFAHPFVASLRLQSPGTYNKLVEDLFSVRNPEIEQIVKDVKSLYNLDPSSSEFSDEVLVRVISGVSLGEINIDRQKGFWKNLWFHIKQLLRKVFGQSINLDSLDENTTVQELSSILLNDKINLLPNQEDYVLYNRELATELENLKDSEVSKSIDTFMRVTQDHLRKLRENKNYSALRDVLKNRYEGSILSDVNRLLKSAKDLEESMTDDFKKLRLFAESIKGIRLVSERMRDHVRDMKDNSDIPEREKLSHLLYYSYMINEWNSTFDELRKSAPDGLPVLEGDISSTIANFKRVKDYSEEVYKKGLLDVFRTQLAPLKEMADREILPEIQRIEELLKDNPGARNLKDRLSHLKDQYKKVDFTDENILKFLSGEMGDTNGFSAMLESYTSSPDPIVGGFAAFLQKEIIKVEAQMQEMSTNLRKELAPLYQQMGVNRSDPAELGRQLVQVDTIPGKREEGKTEGVQVYSLLNPYTGGWLYDYRSKEQELEEARTEDSEKYRKLKEQFFQFQADYFHREYKDEVYDARKFWYESEVNQRAYQKRKEITDKLRALQQLEEQTLDDIEDIETLLRDLRVLASTKNLDGSNKIGEDLEIAKAVSEYNARNRNLYERIEIKGAFERALELHKEDLIDQGLDPVSEEYKRRLNSWVRENTSITLSELFYQEREAIISEIDSILGNLNKNDASKLDIANVWTEIIDQVKGFRDQDGQPIGSDLEDSKIREIKRLQEKVDDIRANLRRMNGLTLQDETNLNFLLQKMKGKEVLTLTEQEIYDDIMKKKEMFGVHSADKARLFALFEDLNILQSKIPTNYYIDTINEKLQSENIPLEVSYENVDEALLGDNIEPILEQYPAFAKWFNRNHVKKSVWNAEKQAKEDHYERLYVWNRIIPNDSSIKEALSSGDYATIVGLKHPHIKISPASKYTFTKIKFEYRTPRVVGETIDNRGNWLPKLEGASDSRYRNEDYFRLKDQGSPLFQILETYKKYHLQAQEGSFNYGKLWMELPRIRKTRQENLTSITQDPGNAVRNILDWGKAAFSNKPKPDAFDTDQIKAEDIKDQNKIYVMTDLFGSEINSIPVKYMSKLDLDLVSLDVGSSIARYAFGLGVNRALHEASPIAKALQNVLETEGIKDVNKISKRSFFGKFTSIPVKGKTNKRLAAISNMIERDIEGVENRMELGLVGNKIASHLMGMASFSSLALNIPAGIKNLVTAKLQNTLEATTGVHFGYKELAQAHGIFFSRFVPNMVRDYNKLSNKSLETQLFEVMDPVQGKFAERFGSEFSASYKKDIANLRFAHSPQSFGEIQAQGEAMIAMMKRTKIPIMGIDGNKSQISYLDAWEMRDGNIKLKVGISDSWAPGGDDYAVFRLKMNKVNEILQGAYAQYNQPEINRFTSGKLITFMRKYFVPAFTNRFAKNRVNVATQTLREGYYQTFYRTGLDMIRNGKSNWHLYTEVEKRNFWRTLQEMTYSMIFLSLISLLGYDGDDPDRNKKLKDNSWAHNMLLYELMMIKGETETFIPFPGMGLNEILRLKDQPSIAFAMMNKYGKALIHFMELIKQPFTDYDLIHYERDQGIHKKGDLKFIADLMKIVGITGVTMDPATGIKNYNSAINRYN